MKTAQLKMKSPIGTLFLLASERGLKSILWEPFNVPFTESKMLRDTATQLTEYFEGRRKKFRLDLDLEGTDFQKKVWQQLLEIPYGETWSYRDLAENVGIPKAFRAVGTANGRNPICIIVPCHRVIAANGTLGGYSGGLERKEKLLEIEGLRFPRSPV